MLKKEEKLDNLDLLILKHLVTYGKEGIRAFARSLKRSPSTISERIKRLERDGYILRHTTLLDYKKLGYVINAITLLQVDGKFIEDVENELAKEPNVRGVYDITGEYDVALLLSFRTVSELDSFIKKLIKRPHIKRSLTSLIFRVVKDNPHVEDFLRK